MTRRRGRSPHNTGLDLTSPDAAQSVAGAPLCLLSGLAAQAHVGLSRKRRVPGPFRQSAAAVSRVGGRAAMWLDSRAVCGLLGEQGSSGAPGQRYVETMIYWHLPVAESKWHVGTQGAPGLRHTDAHSCRGVCGAPGLRCQRASTVAVPRAVRRDSMHQRPRLPCLPRFTATPVRQDCGAKGRPQLPCHVRFAGTPVRRDSGSPRPAVHRRWPAAPLVPSDSMEQRAAPTALISRTGRLIFRVSEQSPPRELHLGSWIYPDPPCLPRAGP